ncbi:hypothetical protein [Chitiniphilus eburneus]|uniref:Glycosyltransferase RgtA/B/C/D-like domain-containing protein n=1 Tax=Chitiniphilus eburneus TaxID=2571148 RepID=A0A4U0Q806_9NEIS|nr:hypothetical protein [Chitiniphilus eburneus]TJZ77401.1 hypothetical protein FAZ21_03425 [Chitiniphilus eburneus]
MYETSLFSKKKLPVVIGALLLIVLWLVAHPYRGIVHDARLYFAQAIYLDNPAAFSSDLFFKFGSQDKYTFFTNAYSFLLSIFGVKVIYFIWLAFQLIWISAVYFIARSAMPARQAIFVSMCLAAVGDNYYGGNGIFEYSEGFLTARIAAEALSLSAIALAMNSKKSIAIGMMLLALICHPLMAIWAALPVIAICFPHPRILISAALLVTVTGLLFFFLYHTNSLDPAWQAQVIRGVPYLYFSEWTPQQKAAPLIDILTIFTAFIAARGRFRLLLFIIIASGCLGYLLSWAASYFDNIFLLKIQPWRIGWITSSFSKFCAGYIFIHAFRHRSKIVNHVFLPIFLSSLFSPSVWLASALAVSWLWLTKYSHSEEQRPLFNFAKLMWLLPLFIIIMAATELPDFQTATPLYNNNSLVFFQYLIGSDIKWLLPFILWGIIFRTPPIIGGMLAVLWITVLLVCWDVRSPLLRELESGPVKTPHAIQSIIRPGDMVYWPDNPELAWIVFRTAHYESGTQAAGMIFSRENALEAGHRYQVGQLLYKNKVLDFNFDAFDKFCRASHVKALVVPASKQFLLSQPRHYLFSLHSRKYGLLLCP